ncbi:hypothetical protein D9M70_335760 [compost metagenome]
MRLVEGIAVLRAPACACAQEGLIRSSHQPNCLAGRAFPAGNEGPSNRRDSDHLSAPDQPSASEKPCGTRAWHRLARRLPMSSHRQRHQDECRDAGATGRHQNKKIRGALPCPQPTSLRNRIGTPFTLPPPARAAARRSVAWLVAATPSTLRGACTLRRNAGCRRAARRAYAGGRAVGHSMLVPSARRRAAALPSTEIRSWCLPYWNSAVL